VACEVLEETGLVVRVERLLLDESSSSGGRYNCYKTYLCIPISGSAKTGFEPEGDSACIYEISAICFVDLFDESSWGQDIKENPVTGPLLRRIRDSVFRH